MMVAHRRHFRARRGGNSRGSARLSGCARGRRTVKVRVYCFMRVPVPRPMIAAGIRTGLGDEWVRVGAIKLICDGSISERTARLTAALRGQAQRLRNSGAQRRGALRSRPQGACGGLADRHARQRRCGDRHHAAHLRAAAARDAAARSALPAGALHRGQSVADPAHSSAGRHPDAVFDLCLLSRRKDARVRARAPELDVRRAQFSGRRHSRHAGVGLSARTVRADDGAAVRRHPHRQPRQRLGTEAAGDRGRGAAGGHDQRRLSRRSTSIGKARSPPGNWRTWWCWAAIPRAWIRCRSSRSPSSGPWWVANWVFEA